ncbi:MAG: U32 family peptidase [Prevotella sp.]|nr:U32 family peptidase [Prevotella sp.]
MRRLELLAPAKDLSCGIAAIDCGADAVYIGAEKFGARAAAGNSVEDIAQLADYARRFRAKVYVTLNTIIYDNEIDEIRRLVERLASTGIDAILVQDLAMLSLTAGTGIPLHASTQTDIRTKDDVRLLNRLGFARVVLARELSLEEIRAIHAAVPDIELEAFVHGALCVSYSGACYASQHFFARSANRGTCAQFCRMKFDLVDSAGAVVKRGSHLLSLKDLALINRLEELADAGITSFKIEGRLKDAAYVKNVVAAYSGRLDELCRRRSDDYARSSAGTTEYNFTPDIRKTFNRGYTEYFFNGRQPDIASFDTPKATGEKVGIVKKIEGKCIIITGFKALSNGDGVCFFDGNNELQGFRINRAEANRLFPLAMPEGLKVGMVLYRNKDAAFDKLLSQNVATRKIPIKLTFSATPGGFSLAAESELGQSVKAEICLAHEPANKPQPDYLRTLLARWGNTIYKPAEVNIEGNAEQYFVQSSVITRLRHDLARLLDEQIQAGNQTLKEIPGLKQQGQIALNQHFKPKNVSNLISKDLYERLGYRDFDVAPEVDPSRCSLPLMQCKHCLRYVLGHCEKHGGTRPAWREPLFLHFGTDCRVRLDFDCKACQMNVWPVEKAQETIKTKHVRRNDLTQ